jgi:CelD/BcsL family acetyltransferase involved in cellulose biosynthesis
MARSVLHAAKEYRHQKVAPVELPMPAAAAFPDRIAHALTGAPEQAHPRDDGMGKEEPQACTFTVVNSRAGFDALEAEWNDLFWRAGKGRQVFQTFNWNWHWCKHFLSTSAEDTSPSLAIVTGRRNGRLIMVWPLVSERVAGLLQLSWMGDPVSQYGDVLVEPDAVPFLADAWAFIARELKPDLLRLRKVRDDAEIATLLGDLNAFGAERHEAPYLDLASAPDFETFERRYSPRSRRNRRRLFRRLEGLGPVLFEHCTESTRARDLAVAAVDLKRDWLKDRGIVSPALADPRFASFFAELAQGGDRPVGCEISALTCRGEPAAIEITLRCLDRIVMHVIVFNLKYEKAGAGALLLERNIAQAFGTNARIFDLLSPGDSYKLAWGDASIGVTDWVIPLSARGWVYARLYLGLARPALKAALDAMPTSLRRLVAERYAG